MDVSVDQAGQERGVAQIDDFGSLLMLYRGADFDDAFVLNKHFAGRDDFAAFDVEEARGMEDDGMLRSGSGGLGVDRREESGRQKCDEN